MVLGNDKAFTFDKVFDIETRQEVIFQEYAQGLIDGYVVCIGYMCVVYIAYVCSICVYI